MAKSASKKKTASKKRTHQRKTTKKSAAPKKSASKKGTPRKWSKKVNETSDAMDLKAGVFKGNDPKKIAKSVKRSASRSHRPKGSPYQSAMSMLNFYINRGGKNLSASKNKVLEQSKEELKKLFDREE